MFVFLGKAECIGTYYPICSGGSGNPPTPAIDLVRSAQVDIPILIFISNFILCLLMNPPFYIFCLLLFIYIFLLDFPIFLILLVRCSDFLYFCVLIVVFLCLGINLYLVLSCTGGITRRSLGITPGYQLCF